MLNAEVKIEGSLSIHFIWLQEALSVWGVTLERHKILTGGRRAAR